MNRRPPMTHFCARRECRRALTADQVRRGGRYCGKACHRRVQNVVSAAVRHTWTARANVTTRAAYFKRVVRVVLEELRPHVDPDGRVSLRHVVRTVLKYRKQGYARGWAARDARERRRNTRQEARS